MAYLQKPWSLSFMLFMSHQNYHMLIKVTFNEKKNYGKVQFIFFISNKKGDIY